MRRCLTGKCLGIFRKIMHEDDYIQICDIFELKFIYTLALRQKLQASLTFCSQLLLYLRFAHISIFV